MSVNRNVTVPSGRSIMTASPATFDSEIEPSPAAAEGAYTRT
jgi:hypothetical protein